MANSIRVTASVKKKKKIKKLFQDWNPVVSLIGFVFDLVRMQTVEFCSSHRALIKNLGRLLRWELQQPHWEKNMMMN